MHDDPIVEEIHKIREQLLVEHGGLDGYVAYLQKMQEQMRVVSSALNRGGLSLQHAKFLKTPPTPPSTAAAAYRSDPQPGTA